MLIQSQYSCVWFMKVDRLSARDWVKAGIAALAKSGFAALKADALAKTLKVSRGSFYWHFADVDAFHAAILERWRQIAYENIVADLDGTVEQRMRTLLNRAFRVDSPLERAIRAWATAQPKVKAMVEAVDAKRMDYIQSLLIEAGLDEARAALRTRILYWAYLGNVLSADRLPSAAWSDILDELLLLVKSKAY